MKYNTLNIHFISHHALNWTKPKSPLIINYLKTKMKFWNGVNLYITRLALFFFLNDKRSVKTKTLAIHSIPLGFGHIINCLNTKFNIDLCDSRRYDALDVFIHSFSFPCFICFLFFFFKIYSFRYFQPWWYSFSASLSPCFIYMWYS